MRLDAKRPPASRPLNPWVRRTRKLTLKKQQIEPDWKLLEDLALCLKQHLDARQSDEELCSLSWGSLGGDELCARERRQLIGSLWRMRDSCDHRLHRTQEWALEKGIEMLALDASFQPHGGQCDCKVAFDIAWGRLRGPSPDYVQPSIPFTD